MNFDKGDIINGEVTGHPIVFLEKLDEYNFAGCMLTHRRPGPGYENIALKEEHFEQIDNTGKKYEFLFGETHFVKVRLLKEAAWGPFKKIGEVTEEGMNYLETKLEGQEPINWHHYLGQQEE